MENNRTDNRTDNRTYFVNPKTGKAIQIYEYIDFGTLDDMAYGIAAQIQKLKTLPGVHIDLVEVITDAEMLSAAREISSVKLPNVEGDLCAIRIVWYIDPEKWIGLRENDIHCFVLNTHPIRWSFDEPGLYEYLPIAEVVKPPLTSLIDGEAVIEIEPMNAFRPLDSFDVNVSGAWEFIDMETIMVNDSVDHYVVRARPKDIDAFMALNDDSDISEIIEYSELILACKAIKDGVVWYQNIAMYDTDIRGGK